MRGGRTSRHPAEMLGNFVEGALSERHRARVERHLARCGTCREEVELARAGRLALIGLPQLDPPRIAPDVLAVVAGRDGVSATETSPGGAVGASAPVATFPATRRARGRDTTVWQRAGWAAGLAAAACIVAALLVSGPGDLGTEGDGAADTALRAARPEGTGGGGGDASLFEYAPDRTPKSFSSLADRLAIESGFNSNQSSPKAVGVPETAQELAGGERECLGRAAQAPAGARLEYLEVGSFEGTPAIIAGYRSDRGTTPLFRLVAVSRVGCALLYGIDVPV